uniref:BREX-2 system phosphatase PglZ n=1 Tax=Streptomyces sp. NBC_00049 TaxID=2903617 RepID=A0AAU2JX85_9ACTN
MAPSLPQVGRRTVEALLERNASALRDRSLVLVHGTYAKGAAAEFTATVAGQPRRVRVRDESSVLGLLDAWREHRAQEAPGSLLVLTTGVDDAQLGWDLRGHAVRRRTLTVNKAEIVLQRFGAAGLDMRMYREDWLLDALVDAEPADRGWPRTAGVLTRDTAVRALVVERLGLHREGVTAPGRETALDPDSMLAWSRTGAGPQRFSELGETERSELKKWLGEIAGPAVPVLLALAETGRGPDAMALGLLGATLRDPAVSPDTVLAVGGLFGQTRPRRAELTAFTDAVEGSMLRWIAEVRGNDSARQRVFAILDRADELARDAGLTAALATSRFLPAGFAAHLSATIEAAQQAPDGGEAELAELTGHALVALYPDRVRVAEMAVRLARWLRLPAPTVAGVAGGVAEHAADWGWVDRALTVLWAGDPGGDPEAARHLRALYEDGRARREALDGAFARHLADWAPHATAQQPGDCLVVERVMETVARPLAAGVPPLLIVLDGMSSAVAAQLGEDVEREGWREVVPRPAPGERPRRLAAVSAFPSVTQTSRASLLTGVAASGGQSAEEAGFKGFWRKKRKNARLFHKASIGGEAGHFLAPELLLALASDAVVGVVLNTIDDALDSGQQGQRTAWSLHDVTYLRELLAAARSYGRPVVLVSDHGHVLDREPGRAAAEVAGAVESARWRIGTDAGVGEVCLQGPRVLAGKGPIIVPWRENIRYSGRRAGYHGGAALAEVTVPVLVLVPSVGEVPDDWDLLPREQAAPSWWRTPSAASTEGVLHTAAPAETGTKSRTKSAKPRQQSEELFTDADVVTAEKPGPAHPAAARDSLGDRVVASEVYEAQKAYVRKAPETAVVTAVINELVGAGGTMSPSALAAAISATGRVRRNIEGFVATVQRLLNVEGYPVLGFIDGGHTVKLDETLLRAQFLPAERDAE